jgi:hypothetical protein
VALQASQLTPAASPTQHLHEALAGVVLLFPVIPVGLAALGTSVRSMWAGARDLLVVTGATVATSALFLLSIAVTFNAATMRYAVDFVPVLVLAACVGAGWACTHAPAGSRRRTVVTSAWLAACAVGAVSGLLLQQTPCWASWAC